MIPPEPAPPDVPDHQLLRVIGEGSYGEVWLARNAVGTMRAVKIIERAKFDSARPYEREFSGLLKYEPLSRSHEGLMDVLHLGRNDRAGYFFYVMELADAADPGHPASSGDSQYRPKTLSFEIRRHQRVPPEDCLRHFISLAGALEHLHRNGLIHRDVKPSNIIFVGGVAKLADIGLVAEMSESRSFVGTEGFIPLEGPGTAQADVYSLGKVLYEAVTGMDRLEFPSLPLGRGELAGQRAMLELNAIAMKACAPPGDGALSIRRRDDGGPRGFAKRPLGPGPAQGCGAAAIRPSLGPAGRGGGSAGGRRRSGGCLARPR